jgi:hypothetical protein
MQWATVVHYVRAQILEDANDTDNLTETYVRKTNKMHTFLKNLFLLIIPDMFRTNNFSPSAFLYKQLTVFHHES